MASDEAKPASPAAADPPADDATQNTDPEVEVKAEGTKQEEQKTPEKKRRGRRKKSEVEAEKKTPTPKKPTPGIDRPSRERKTVERYAELAPRVTPVKKSPAILQVRRSTLPSRPDLLVPDGFSERQKSVILPPC
jgi:protein DEK